MRSTPNVALLTMVDGRGRWCMAHGAWCMAHNTWHSVRRRMVHGTQDMALRTTAHGAWRTTHGAPHDGA
eukprot:352294-Chlamydomonas_euryale.AAC.3